MEKPKYWNHSRDTFTAKTAKTTSRSSQKFKNRHRFRSSGVRLIPEVRRVMQEVGFEQVTEQEQWHIFWTDLPLSLDRVVKMKIFQKINHFPGMTEICRKDFLARNLNRMCKQFPKDYKFFSRTWLLPSELLQLYVYLNTHRNSIFIIKPENNCQGRGIYLVKDVSELGVQSRGICQQYIKKKKLRMHLTNYSINKTSENFKQDAEHGNKRKISTVMRYLQSNGYDVSTVWTNIDDAVIKTLLSALPVLQYNYKAYFPSHELLTSPCFEILGFDVLLNYKLKPYILEVNHSPSYNTDSSVDKEVKESLLRDSLKLLTITCHACKETQTSMLKKTPCGILPFDQRCGLDPYHMKGSHSFGTKYSRLRKMQGLFRHQGMSCPMRNINARKQVAFLATE
ncbi:tubulin polyglutamylase TTLL6-like [Tachypleus tridentatus]|uniref:tubulin polyglutamylase TTLL6-like n=1 Tax=Tachypleus tridentatus TaxID=6853 RepID=UPI003FCF6C2E